MPNAPRLILCLALALPASGCCTIARFFCGADETPWVPISFASPDATLATFQEAFAKDDAIRLSACLSEGLKASLGVDALAVRFVKDRLADQVPGLHMVGYAEVVERAALSPDRVTYRLEVAGREFTLTMVRQAFWEVRSYDPNDPFAAPRQDGEWIRPDQLGRLATVRPGGADSAVAVDLPPVAFENLEAGQLQSAGVGFQWKVDAFEVPDGS